MSDDEERKPTDLPFLIAVLRASQQVHAGATIWQKFTCEHCGSRQTIEKPNAMYASGTCEECGRVTDISSRGCGFMMEI